METELLRKIINVYLDENKFIPFVIKNYIEGNWCLFSRDNQLLICQLINDRLNTDFVKFNNTKYRDWLNLLYWMQTNLKQTDITWDASK